MNSGELTVKSLPLIEPKVTEQGTMNHVLEILASHSHPFISIGSSAQRWMGSAGFIIDNSCDLLIRDSALESIASSLIETNYWKRLSSVSKTNREQFHWIDWQPDAEIVLQATGTGHDSGYEYLALWSETTYHLHVDDCPLVEVPDICAWNNVLIEEHWHPAIHRTDDWWFGPYLRPDTRTPNLPKAALVPVLFPKGVKRGKSPSNPHSVFVPSLPAYIDALVYHVTHYKASKPGLATISALQIDNLTRYLYLELPHQQWPLLIELEEYKYMDEYLQKYKRKPFFVYRKVPGGEFESARVKQWDPTSYPD